MLLWNLLLILLWTQGCPFVDQPSVADITRAKTTRPRKALLGYGATNIRRQLNQHLEYGNVAYPEGMARPCEDFTVEELIKIQKALAECSYESPTLGKFYTDRRRNDRRRLSGELHPSILTGALLSNDSETLSAVKVGICHILSMQWVHRLTDATRKAFAEREEITSLPLLPILGAAEHLPVLSTKGALGEKLSSWLQDSVTCEIGHDASPEDGDWSPDDLPVWPFEVTYNASGYGPYPFWCDGSPSDGNLDGAGANISVWYSAVQNAERYDHSSCGLSDMGTTDGPCTNLFVNGSWAFLFKQDLSFCCLSSAPSYLAACHLTRPQRDFMDVMDYDGELANYTQEDGLYTGKAKKWSMHLSHPGNFYFWYITDEDGLPLEQGEGPCNMYNREGGRDCRGPPKMLFHQYHPGTWKPTEIPSSVFDVPEVCLDSRTRTTCLTTPANLCR